MGRVDYDLARLTTRDFEHLTQALAIEVIGPGVEVFGDGRDGGREAVFEGLMRYPDPAPDGVWDGYGVLQAKFRQRPLSTELDTAWFLAETRSELRRWANPKSARARSGRIPEYLVLATNVVLSPVSESGGIDTVKRDIGDLIAKLKLPIKDFRVWHFDQIRGFLDGHPKIRQTYDGMITTGDVLAYMLRYMEAGGQADIAERAATYAIMQMEADRWVRLHQAGSGDNQQLPLADIAVDLLASVRSDGTGSREESVGVAAFVVRHGDRILRPQGGQAVQRVHTAVLGGPGQGKSTLSQVICQVYRVAFLAQSTAILSDEQRKLLLALKERFDQIGLPEPVQHRWPIRIDLAAYSDAIAGGEQVSILRFLATQINLYAPEVNANQLRGWLGRWPWLLVLDGLDEVASTAARDAVLTKLDQFYTEARQSNADLFVITTSRIHGYREEFNESSYSHLTLTPLNPDQALAYAGRLTAVRFAGDPENAKKVLDRLEEAAAQELTARLMRSPLQVTIMSILLERRERVPQERYRLFSAYYETIYSREVGKPGPVGKMLDAYRTTVDRIHYQAGLTLQAEAESVGEHAAVMPLEELARLTADVLRAAGHDDPGPTAALAGHLVTAVTQRLGLLTPPPRQDNALGFDVRSLQEYMAAQAIVRDQAADIASVLRTIAWSAHWRNTWLLAAGNVFHAQGRQRHSLITLLGELQSEDQLSMLLKPGSLMAADLLDDDVAAAQPKFRRLLVTLALQLLEVPPEPTIHQGLSRVLYDSMRADTGCRALVDQAIDRALLSTGVPAVTALALLSGWKDRKDATGIGNRARRLLDQARKSLPPTLLAAAEENFRWWPVGPTFTPGAESSVSLGHIVEPVLRADLDTVPQWLDQLRGDAHQVKLRTAANGSGVDVTVTVSDFDPVLRAEDPHVRGAMVHVAPRLPVEHWLAAAYLRSRLWAWAERRPSADALLAVVALDEEDS
jgi:hypothetical protein